MSHLTIAIVATERAVAEMRRYWDAYLASDRCKQDVAEGKWDFLFEEQAEWKPTS